MQICCLYNLPKNSPYRWLSESLISLTNELNQYAKKENCDSIIITGDINFDNTIWQTLISSDEYENSVLESLGKRHFKKILNQKEKNQLEIFLINNPSNVINRSELNEFNRSFSSDHKACKIFLQLTHENILRCKRQKCDRNKIGWNKLNAIIAANPFNPYCYSNLDALVNQWYKLLEKILAKKTFQEQLNTGQVSRPRLKKRHHI